MIFSPGEGWGGGGVTQQMFIRVGSAPRSNSPPFYMPFSRKRYPFVYLLLANGTPLIYLVQNFASLLTAVKSARLSNRNQSQKLNSMFSRLYKTIKFICQPFQALSQTQMTDFPTLLYTSTSEIPPLSYTLLQEINAPRN